MPFMDKAIESVYIEGAVPKKTIPDSFGKSLDAIQNEIKTLYIDDLDNQFKEWIHRIGGSIKSLFGKFLDKINFKLNGIISLDTVKSIMDKGKDILGYVGTGMALYNDVKNKNLDGIMNFARGALGNGIVDTVQFGINAYRDIKATDWSNFESILGLASRLTGVDIGTVIGYTDLKAKIGAVMELAQRYGITDAIKQLRNKFGKDKDLSYTLAMGLRQNTLMSQTDTIQEILGLINGKLAGAVYPELVYDLLSNYRFPKNEYTDSDLVKWKADIIDICNKVDPNWGKVTINGTTYTKLMPWMNVSEHASMLFQFDETYGVPCVIGRSYPTRTTRDCLNEMYPYLNI